MTLAAIGRNSMAGLDRKGWLGLHGSIIDGMVSFKLHTDRSDISHQYPHSGHYTALNSFTYIYNI
jgi:hypothetical protein